MYLEDISLLVLQASVVIIYTLFLAYRFIRIPIPTIYIGSSKQYCTYCFLRSLFQAFAVFIRSSRHFTCIRERYCIKFDFASFHVFALFIGMTEEFDAANTRVEKSRAKTGWNLGLIRWEV